MVNIKELPPYMIMALIIYAETKEGDKPQLNDETIKEVEAIMEGLRINE